MSKKPDQKNQRIQVFARCRPLNSIERKQCSPSVVEVIPEKKEIALRDRNTNREFFFDKVFPPDTKQIAVYKSVVEPLIQEVLKGYNCTVFAYGQTGTGKTYTMEGERNNSNCSWEDDPGAGIIPRSLHQLFEELNKEENVEFSVRVSFLELYNEELFDLLSVTELSRLRLFEDSARKGSVIIQGLEEIAVNTKDEVYTILEKGTSRRQTAATMLNATSSRSHTVFSVTVHIKENTVEGEELLKTGKLNLVDLAGSENVGRSGAIDKRAREAGNINQSLLTLGRVITALIEKQPHVPYRESKLTRLLQDSLGGHTKTSIIATISPALCNFEETISTLDYATKAKSITIRPEINQKMTKRALIKEYTEEIERLRKDLSAQRSNEGFYIHLDNYAHMQTEISSKAEDIKKFSDKIEMLTEENAKIEEMFNSTKEVLGKTYEELNQTSKMYKKTSQELDLKTSALAYSQQILSRTTLERDEKQYLINIQKNTEKKLSQQAQALLCVADTSTNDVDKLHAKLDRLSAVEKTNDQQSQEFKKTYQKQIAKLDDMVTSAKEEQVKNLLDIKECMNNMFCGLLEYKQMSSECLSSTLKQHESQVDSFSSDMEKFVSSNRQWADTTRQDINSKMSENSSKQQSFLNNKLSAHFSQLEDKTLEMENWILNIERSLNTKINEYKASLELQTAKKKSIIHDIQTSIDTFYCQHERILKELDTNTQAFSDSRKQSQEEINDIVSLLSKYCGRQEKESEMWGKVCNDKNNLINHLPEIKSTENPMHLLKAEENSFEASLETFNEFQSAVKVEEFAVQKEALIKSYKTISQEITNCVQENDEFNKESYASIEDNLEKHFQEIYGLVTSNQEELKSVTQSLSEKLNADKSNLEQHNSTLQTIATEATNRIMECEKAISQATDSVKAEILQRDLEFEKFLSEDLIKDTPTGTTPLRKNFVYPKALAATSPHDRILQRYRTQLAADTAIAVNLPLDNSFDESPEGKHSNEDSSSQNASLVSDDFDLSGCETDSNASSMSDVSVDSFRNKENNKKSKSKKSRLPKKLPKKNEEFLKPPQPRQARKPLSTSNESPLKYSY